MPGLYAPLPPSLPASPAATYAFLTPELWRETVFTKIPLQEYSGGCRRAAGGWRRLLFSSMAMLGPGTAGSCWLCIVVSWCIGELCAGWLCHPTPPIHPPTHLSLSPFAPPLAADFLAKPVVGKAY